MEPLLDERVELADYVLESAKWACERGDVLTPIQSTLLGEYVLQSKKRLKKLKLVPRRQMSMIQAKEHDHLAREIDKYARCV